MDYPVWNIGWQLETLFVLWMCFLDCALFNHWKARRSRLEPTAIKSFHVLHRRTSMEFTDNDGSRHKERFFPPCASIPQWYMYVWMELITLYLLCKPSGWLRKHANGWRKADFKGIFLPRLWIPGRSRRTGDGEKKDNAHIGELHRGCKYISVAHSDDFGVHFLSSRQHPGKNHPQPRELYGWFIWVPSIVILIENQSGHERQ